MNKTTENLISALKGYRPCETVAVTYRLIYDVNTGNPVAITTDATDQPHIEISKDEASAQPQLDPRVKIENGKLTRHFKRLQATEEPNRLCVTIDPAGNIATDDYSMLILNSIGKNRWKYE